MESNGEKILAFGAVGTMNGQKWRILVQEKGLFFEPIDNTDKPEPALETEGLKSYRIDYSKIQCLQLKKRRIPPSKSNIELTVCGLKYVIKGIPGDEAQTVVNAIYYEMVKTRTIGDNNHYRPAKCTSSGTSPWQIIFGFILVLWLFGLLLMHYKFIDSGRFNLPQQEKVSVIQEQKRLAQSEQKSGTSRKKAQTSLSEKSESREIRSGVDSIYYDAFANRLIAFCTLFIGGATVLFVLQSAASFLTSGKLDRLLADAEEKLKEAQAQAHVLEEIKNQCESELQSMKKSQEKIAVQLSDQDCFIGEERRHNILFISSSPHFFQQEILSSISIKTANNKDKAIDFFITAVNTLKSDLEKDEKVADVIELCHLCNLLLSYSQNISAAPGLQCDDCVNNWQRINNGDLFLLSALSCQIAANLTTDRKERIRYLNLAKDRYVKINDESLKKHGSLVPQYILVNKIATYVKLAALSEDVPQQEHFREADVLLGVFDRLQKEQGPIADKKIKAYGLFNAGMKYYVEYVLKWLDTYSSDRAGASNLDLLNRAIQYFEEANEHYSPIALWVLACTYSTLGDYEKAWKSLDDSLAALKNSAVNKNYLVKPSRLEKDIMIGTLKKQNEERFGRFMFDYKRAWLK